MSECNHAVAGSCAKCEPCGVCGRPKGDPHRYPVAGECTAPDSSDYTVSLQCLSIALRKARDDIAAAEERGRLAAAVMCKCGDELQPDDGAICGACLQPEIAEAEERGRRRGVEEREELRLVLWDALAVIQSRAPDMTVLIPRIRAALAPRDSAPALDVEATLECSRDAERILGERLKAAREILADCRRFVNSPPTVQGADLRRRIDAAIAQGDRP